MSDLYALLKSKYNFFQPNVVCLHMNYCNFANLKNVLFDLMNNFIVMRFVILTLFTIYYVNSLLINDSGNNN